jgi:hypothetical protein
MSKPNVIIRMGAAAWDARVKTAAGAYVSFNFRAMEKKERSTFHREFMNAFRESLK